MLGPGGVSFGRQQVCGAKKAGFKCENKTKMCARVIESKNDEERRLRYVFSKKHGHNSNNLIKIKIKIIKPYHFLSGFRCGEATFCIRVRN